ncbi:isochorismatase [Actinoplanes italicus]|uniref:Nicotinamidase-related amidase n=1 Tax=Actinoplanes italicus TaxID=113567 RepID=A0A2T0K1C9_9ACTN|nr:isochorismatase family protein [Actinoplanes italicus]PRX16597.1 nicotinamidase-related amidase [Actinoplanes italicus]GIE33805.1 isochorismatase [Actinoplanes italicus]
MSTPKRALILVDVQQEYFGGLLEIQYPPHADSLPRITAAIDAAIAAGVPVVVVQHSAGDQAPVFNPTRPGYLLHPEVASRRTDEWKSVVKQFSSVFAGTDVAAWLRDQGVDTVTLAGYMTNNCILASAVEAESHGFAAEVLSDATGAIHIANEAGFTDAKTVHTSLMALFNSNLAAVADTATWSAAVTAGEPLPAPSLGASAAAGAKHAGQG